MLGYGRYHHGTCTFALLMDQITGHHQVWPWKRVVVVAGGFLEGRGDRL